MKSQILAPMLIVGSLLINITAQAQSVNGVSKDASSDKVDIRKLEQKYWAAKDDDFAVVQNRRYSKANRFYVSLLGGVPINDPYSTGNILGLNTGYFINERWGFNLEFTQASLKDNETVNLFAGDNNVYPNNNKFISSKSISASFFPLYAKMSFLDKAIIYFDMGLTLGVGTVDYISKVSTGDVPGSSPSYSVTVTQQIFFTNHFALRLDYVNRWTDEMRRKFNPVFGGEIGKKVYNDTALLLGLNFWY